jgi:hypothetical protein
MTSGTAAQSAIPESAPLAESACCGVFGAPEHSGGRCAFASRRGLLEPKRAAAVYWHAAHWGRSALASSRRRRRSRHGRACLPRTCARSKKIYVDDDEERKMRTVARRRGCAGACWDASSKQRQCAACLAWRPHAAKIMRRAALPARQLRTVEPAAGRGPSAPRRGALR